MSPSLRLALLLEAILELKLAVALASVKYRLLPSAISVVVNTTAPVLLLTDSTVSVGVLSNFQLSNVVAGVLLRIYVLLSSVLIATSPT